MKFLSRHWNIVCNPPAIIQWKSTVWASNKQYFTVDKYVAIYLFFDKKTKHFLLHLDRNRYFLYSNYSARTFTRYWRIKYFNSFNSNNAVSKYWRKYEKRRLIRFYSYHDSPVNEAPPESRRPQVRILLGTRDLDVPDLLPSFVEALVDGVDTRVVGTNAVTTGRGYLVFLRELLVQYHVLLQMRHVLVQVGLLVVPHVRKPRKSENFYHLVVSLASGNFFESKIWSIFIWFLMNRWARLI